MDMQGYEDPVYDEGLWERIPAEFREWTLDKLVHHRLELEHFKQFLAENYASMDLMCWMDIEAFRRSVWARGARVLTSRRVLMYWGVAQYHKSRDKRSCVTRAKHRLLAWCQCSCNCTICIYCRHIVHILYINVQYIETQ